MTFSMYLIKSIDIDKVSERLSVRSVHFTI